MPLKPLFTSWLLLTGLFFTGIGRCVANGVWMRMEGAMHQNRFQVWVGWENGWDLDSIQPPGNRDGVWLFIKAGRAGQQKHVQIESAHTAYAGFRTEVAADGNGITVETAGHRSFKRDSCLVEVTTATDIPSAEPVDIHGIEMAYVPRGSFWAGDGISNSALHQGGQPLQIDSETTLTVNGVSGLQALSVDGPFTIGQAFPKGVSSFWAMKYEISQEQVADFFNSIGLSTTEALIGRKLQEGDYLVEGGPNFRIGLRYLHGTIGVDGNRNGLPDQLDDGLARACGGMSWQVLCAWLDWAALRPMTELEYEKMARGPQAAKPRAFAWGEEYPRSQVNLPEDGYAGEGLLQNTDTLPRAVYGAQVGQPYLHGPARTGFAGNEASGRVQAGCGYYGHFELSGNVWEQALALHPDNRDLAVVPGDGRLTSNGYSDTDWATAHYILRGGGWDSLIFPALSYPFRDLAVSDRFYHTIQEPAQGRPTVGGRGVR